MCCRERPRVECLRDFNIVGKQPRNVTRICIFAHFDRDNLVDEYVFYYLEALNRAGCGIVFASTSAISEHYVNRLRRICDQTILRKNVGYDFGSWQAGLRAVPELSVYDEVLICNDSVYGPLYPLEEMFRSMEQVECDFWGATDSQGIAYHLQSYFLVFRKSVIGSEQFRHFWNGVAPQEDKDLIIKKYEVGLTQTLLGAGFKPAVYASYHPTEMDIAKRRISSLFKRNPYTMIRKWIKKGITFDKKAVNLTHFYWRELVRECRMPFIKIELLRDNPMRTGVGSFENFIQEHSTYPVDLIKHHLERVKLKKK